jgi:PAS domain S-box-containing protein
VLHLEDIPRDAEVVRGKLDAGGVPCDILVTDCKQTFEAALTREPFDLIICDYNLPGYDGVAALKQAQTVQPDAPVILVSGTVGEEQAVKCLQFGATDYLLKERLDRLVPAVRRAIQESESRRNRKVAEAALAQSENRKTAILESVLDCIVTMDAAGTVLEFNAAAEATFGYTKAQAIGRPLAELIIPPRLRDAHAAGLARYVATGEGPLLGKVVEITAVRSDGSEFPVELAISVIRSGSAPMFIGVLRDITARRRADEPRARLAAIVNSSDDAIYSIGLDGTILTWNAGAERLFGYPASEIIGSNPTHLSPIAASGDLPAILERAACGQTGEAFDARRTRKDGSTVDISVTISPITDSTGRVTGVAAIARDATTRTTAEAELKRLNHEILAQRLREVTVAKKRAADLEQEIVERRDAELAVRGERDRAQRYLDAPEVMLLALDTEGRVTLANRYACSLLGWTRDDLIGRDWFDCCLPARTRDEVRVRLRDRLNGDQSVAENPVLTRSGTERLIEWHNTVQRNDAGQVTGTFSSGTDVTERNRAVEALRTAEERMRFALQSANVGIWDMDYGSGVLRWSETLEAQHGLEPGTFGGTSEAFVERVHPDDRGLLLGTLELAAVSGADFTSQYRSMWPDGTVRWLSGAGRVHLGEDARPVRGVGISLDVTERRVLEEQYQQAQKMEAIGQLAGGVAHDFNNLLTVILGNCELLRDSLSPDNQGQADIAEIQKAGESAAGLTRQLLAFSRKEIIEPTLLDLNAVLTNMRPMLTRLIREDIKIILSLRPEPVPITADRGQIEQVVLNLAVNARDAMPSGGTLTIEVSPVVLDDAYAETHAAVAAGPYAALTMTDTGAGMPPEILSRLFEPFFTTKAVGKGTGLGLATVHGIISRSGGSIDVTSAVDRGSSFKVYFPSADGAQMAVDAAPAALRLPAGAATVLVVEDSAALRVLTEKLLQRLGFTVLVAADAEQALRVFEENPSIDVLLTDVVMPGASGPELTKRLVERWPALKVIYMSGHTDETIVDHGVITPGITFLQKPFTSENLRRRLHEVLAK